MNIDYLLERISELNAQNVQIYEGNIKGDPSDLYPVFTIRDAANAAAELSKFRKHFTGGFTAFIRTDKKQARTSGERLYFYNQPDGSTAPPVNGVIHGQLTGSMDDIRKQIRKEFEDERAKEDLMEQFKELRAQLSEMRKPEQRLMYIAEELASRFGVKMFPGNAPAQPIIQGTQAANSNTNQQPTQNDMQGTNTAPMGPYNMENIEEGSEEEISVEDAFAVIYSYLGTDLLVRVGKALQRDPSLAKKLDLFI